MGHPTPDDYKGYQEAIEQEIRKAMEKGESQIMKIPVNHGMNLAIPQEMVERWHQDLRTIIKLHEDNGRLQLLLYETQDKLK